MKKYISLFWGVILGLLLLFSPSVRADTSYSQSIPLLSGWNIISTPKVLNSHSFSVAETSSNFDIYALDPSKTSKWVTLADLGQTEFTPLYGYFINNKTGTNQTLTLNYEANVTPNQKLFSRTFTNTGWYSFGVANTGYVLPVGTSSDTDTNNPSRIMSGMSGFYDSVVDLTDGLFSSNPDTTSASTTWKSAIASDVNSLHDFRETKGYAIFINKANGLYVGLQGDTNLVFSNGTMNVTKSTSVSSQNIAVNLAKQILGGFDVEVKGEQITVASMKINLSIAKTAGESVDTNDLTSIALYDASGNVVAGPVDGVAGGVNAISFTDTVTFPVGKNTYTVMGKVGTDIGNNDTITASTTPSGWGTVKGVTTGNSITPAPDSAVTSNTMTVKSASLNITTSPTPSAQSVVAGTNAFTFANFVFDATGSGEDIRTTSVKPTLYMATANTGDDLSNCQLFDGATALNTGSNIVNPDNTNSNATAVAFNFDSGLTVTKGTVRTITLKCNVRANPDGTAGASTYAWGLTPATAANVVSTGLTSGQAVTETGASSTGQNMTLQTGGTLAVIADTSSPQLKWVQAGATDQTLAIFRVNSTFEDIRLERMGFQIATSADANTSMASNTPSDISKITLWNGAKKIGEATFSSGDYATTTFTTEFGASQSDYTLLKDDQMLITVKGDIGSIGVNTQAYPGHLIVVNYDGKSGDDETHPGLKGTGLSSGTAVYGTATDQTTNGARIARAIPTVERVALSSTKFANVSGQTLYKFKVTAPAGTNGVSLYKFTFLVSTSVSGYLQEFPTGPDGTDPAVPSYQITNYQVFCYDDINFSNASCGNTSGLLNDSGVSDFSTMASTSAGDTNDQAVSVYFNPTNPTSSTDEAIAIPAGQTRYFVLKADVTGASSTPSITVKMQGDATFASLNNGANFDGNGGSCGGDITCLGDNWTTGRYVFATTAANVDAWDDNDFIWSGNSTNTAMSVSAYDWFNGYQVPGVSNSDVGSAETLTLTN